MDAVSVHTRGLVGLHVPDTRLRSYLAVLSMHVMLLSLSHAARCAYHYRQFRFSGGPCVHVVDAGNRVWSGPSQKKEYQPDTLGLLADHKVIPNRSSLAR